MIAMIVSIGCSRNINETQIERSFLRRVSVEARTAETVGALVKGIKVEKLRSHLELRELVRSTAFLLEIPKC